VLRIDEGDKIGQMAICEVLVSGTIKPDESEQ
jgi:hypothetical protein